MLLVTDLKCIWEEAKLGYSSENSEFCPVCQIKKSQRHEVPVLEGTTWRLGKSMRVMDQPYNINTPYCPRDWMIDSLHGGIRPTEPQDS